MRVLFINFNLGSTAGINNGIAILSAVLKERHHEVGLLFLCEELGYPFDLRRMRDDILEFKPDLIGISLMETQSKYVPEFCTDARTYYKGFIICGGPYPTMAPEDVLAMEGVDAVCVGEGEDAIIELVEARQKGREYRNIRNIWSRGRDGSLIRNRLRTFADLDKLPPEDKELFDLDGIIRLKNGQLEVMLGRGCSYRCAYCINESYVNRYREYCDEPVSMRDYVRIKKADTVLREIRETVARHPHINKLAFIDDNLLMYERFLEEFCRRYKEEVSLPFMCNANPVSFTAGKGRLLRDAGCDDIRFGVESGSERVKSRIMKRPIPNRAVIGAFAATRELGLMTSSFNMIGLPTETKEEVLETLKLNAAIMPDTVKVMTFYPFKNTPLYDLCEKNGLIDHEKKKELDNYDTFTCLKFDPAHRLFLRKVQTAFNWYINAFLENHASADYAYLIYDIEKMKEDEWNSFDFCAADEEMSKKWRREGVPHYSKYVNRSLAVKFPSGHLAKAELTMR